MSNTDTPRTIRLYNLYLGDKRPNGRFANVQVGPFTIRLVDEYEDQVRKIPHGESRTDHGGFDLEAGTRDFSTTYQKAGGAGWHVTAVATVDDSAAERSILCGPPADDHGVWDLCIILSFLTGRRVATDDLISRVSPAPGGTHACTPIFTLAAAGAAWPKRANVVERGLNHRA